MTRQILRPIILLLLALLAGSPPAKADKLYADEIFAILQEKQNRIDYIRQGISEAWQYLDLDNVKEYAQYDDFPQRFLDLQLARFNRIMSKMNFAAAAIADDAAKLLIDHQSDGTLSPIVMEEGIAKYTSMRDFFEEYANNTVTEFCELWYRYHPANEFPANDLYIFDDDNLFMMYYGVSAADWPDLPR